MKIFYTYQMLRLSNNNIFFSVLFKTKQCSFFTSLLVIELFNYNNNEFHFCIYNVVFFLYLCYIFNIEYLD